MAIARAFAYPADILLMDEPFKDWIWNLKQALLSPSLLWNQDKRTVIFVTHDMDEALSFAHDIYILEGRPLGSRIGAKPS